MRWGWETVCWNLHVEAEDFATRCSLAAFTLETAHSNASVLFFERVHTTTTISSVQVKFSSMYDLMSFIGFLTALDNDSKLHCSLKEFASRWGQWAFSVKLRSDDLLPGACGGAPLRAPRGFGSAGPLRAEV